MTFMHELFADLRWLGLDWDEGPDVGGPHASYRQQQRRAIYEEWLAKLDAAGLTYPCFCTPAELSIARKRAARGGQAAALCRERAATLTEEQRAERLVRGLPAALRFRVPAGQVVAFDDVVHGEQRFATDDIGDFIIRRADGSTAFFFSNAIDDALMGVTLVLRGDDHMTNTPRQMLILQALGLPIPQLRARRAAARHGRRAAVEAARRAEPAGPAQARVSARCDPQSSRAPRSLDDDGRLARRQLRCARTSICRASAARAAKFDDAQLRHWQKEAVAHLSPMQFHDWIAAELPTGLDPQRRAAFAAAVRPNVELPRGREGLGERRVRPAAGVVVRSGDRRARCGRALLRRGCGRARAQRARISRTQCSELGQLTGRKGPALYMPLRAALTGATHGPELAPMLAADSRQDEVQARLAIARDGLLPEAPCRYSTPTRVEKKSSSRSSPASCACTCAAIRSTTTATSVTRARRSRSTSCAAICQYRGYKVTFVRNITDIDDNIIKRAAENGESVQSLTEPLHEGDARGLRPARHPAAGSRAEGDRARARHHRDDAAADRQGLCVRRDQRRRDVFGLEVRGVRQAVRPAA